MIIIRNMGPGHIYVGFPSTNYGIDLPKEITAWLNEYNINPQWGTTNGQQTGFFLSGEDASAFRLRFNV